MKFNKSARIVSLVLIAAGLSVNGYAQSFITNGLVAYYPFNGNANDASGNGINGTVYGATLTTDRFGNSNAAYYFNGSSSYIITPLSNTAFSGDFTVSLWFNAFDFTNGFPTLLYEQNGSLGMGIVGQTSGTSSPNLIGEVNATCSYAPATYSWQLFRPTVTPLNTFDQLVVTKAGTNVTMYWNGQIAVVSQSTSPATLAGSYVTIGREDVTLYGDYTDFHGVIDDIRVYNLALSSNQVQQLYAYESRPVVGLKQAFKPAFSNLYLGTNYQLQISSDLTNWTNFGSPFMPTNTVEDFTNYFDTDIWGKLFFRLQTSP